MVVRTLTQMLMMSEMESEVGVFGKMMKCRRQMEKLIMMMRRMTLTMMMGVRVMETGELGQAHGGGYCGDV